MFRIPAALFAVPLLAGPIGASAGPAAAAPPYPAASPACEGEGVDPGAPVRHRTETVIHAPLRTVWKLQADVERWPSWQAHVETADRLDHGPLRAGSVFRWTTPVPPNPVTPAGRLDIISTVEQIERHSCVRWTGPASGEGLHIDGVHVWTFTKVRGGVRVITEETHTGPQVDAYVPVATGILRQGLEGWLRDLKAAAESRAHHRPR
ncbi:SRPBCC family protein [Streptomyces sp. CAU 1734]|uniref:SRPBCC family protein n=1 Tax=Streptomyces sp. CAU 1734 TaxID=3140360 RepID=UPI00326134CB